MKKDLPTHLISNELAGSSVFFPGNTPMPIPQSIQRPSEAPTNGDRSIKQPHDLDTTVARNHATVPPRHDDEKARLAVGADFEEIRQVVKQVGKEAATYRLTPEEKQQLGELVYRFGHKGYRTSENEITRIAINWLLRDHQDHGMKSVLAQLLDALHR